MNQAEIETFLMIVKTKNITKNRRKFIFVTADSQSQIETAGG
ncbi:MAG: hypothetical protein ACLTST_05500 [Lachnospiraceae bacterium]